MKIFALCLVLLFGLTILGCGGNGGGGNKPSVFQGPFNGTWTATDSSQGTAAIQITANGSFSGQFVNTTMSLTGTISGTISGTGTIEGTITLGGNNYQGSGTFSISEDRNTLTGTLTRNSTTWTFNLQRTIM